MSDGPKMSLPFARNLANRMIEMLESDCGRIEIAGSIRRCKPEVGDIEIVLIPKPTYDLLGYPVFGAGRIEDALLREGFVLPKNGEFLKQARLPSGTVNFDIFLTTPEKWGVIYTIRTGSADFSKWLVTSRQHGGAMPSNMHVKEGRLFFADLKQPLDTPEESDFFREIGQKYIEPEKRTEGFWKGTCRLPEAHSEAK